MAAELAMKHAHTTQIRMAYFDRLIEKSKFPNCTIRERQWHQSQKITELENGGLSIEMNVQGQSGGCCSMGGGGFGTNGIEEGNKKRKKYKNLYDQRKISNQKET